MTDGPTRVLGAYGLRLYGLEEAAELLAPADPGWPALNVETRRGAVDAGHDLVGPDHASLRLRTGGRVEVERRTGEAVIRTPRELRPAEIVHPYLAPIAAVMAYWWGRESFHGGAVCIGEGAWGILGERGAGKSTLLAQLASTGTPVLSDDQLVVDDVRCFAGPRSVDLRREAATRLSGADELGVVGARERWRLHLGRVSPDVRLDGWFYLEWGETVSVTPVFGAERVARLGRHRGLRIPPRDPAKLLSLAARPSYVLTRPRRWDALAECAHRLTDAARRSDVGPRLAQPDGLQE